LVGVIRLGSRPPTGKNRTRQPARALRAREQAESVLEELPPEIARSRMGEPPSRRPLRGQSRLPTQWKFGIADSRSQALDVLV
jgi:hypothetical protein